MAEGSNVRLVRCPNCDNLLQELREYSVYQCGGCGTILRAKKRDPGSDELSEKSGEEKGLRGLEKSESSTEKGSGRLDFASRAETEDGESESNWRRKESAFVEKKDNNFGKLGFRRTAKEEISVREDIRIVGGEFKDLRLERSVEETEYGSVDRHDRLSEREMDQQNPRANRGADINGPHSYDKVPRSLRSRPRMDWSRVERGRVEGLCSVPEQKRAPEFPFAADEGPSNYDPYSFHGHSGVEQLEHERAELLRKLDELKEQLSRSSYHVPDKPNERESSLPRPYVNQGPYNAAVHPPPADHFLDHSQGPAPYVNRRNVDARSFYPPPSHKIPEYDDPFQPQMMSRNPHHRPTHQYPQLSPRPYSAGQYRNFDLDPIAPYARDNFFHAPTCSCLACYNQNLQVHPHVPHYKGPPQSLNPNLYHHDDPVMVGPQGYLSPQSRDPRMHMRWPGDLESEHDGYGRPRRVVVSNTAERRVHPVAGGAPFITCRKCFELLRLPRNKHRTANNYRQKLRCGACSALILVKVEDRKLVTSDITELKNTSAEDDQSFPELLNDITVSSGSFNANCASSCSEDFKKSSFNFLSAVTEPSLLVAEAERLNLGESESESETTMTTKKKVYSSSPSVSSREEESVPCAVPREDVRESDEFPLKTVLSPVPPHSPMWHKADSPRRVVGRYGSGNTSKRSENESGEKAFGSLNYRENSVREDEAEATELDVSFDEYQHNMSQDFAETSKEDYPLRFSKGNSDSFLVGFIKRSLKDFSRSSHSVETENPKVYINGHPLRDRVVKSAEMHAGPIRPGDYWYDYKAGFWGVMGQPCLGIVPSGIEEFNYPMPTNCGAGNTGVYINGRELNQRDLDLLASRGLPTTRDKFYVVEINGKVFEEGSNKEAYNLGKLAPTVEKAKHGFGMKVPRAVS